MTHRVLVTGAHEAQQQRQRQQLQLTRAATGARERERETTQKKITTKQKNKAQATIRTTTTTTTTTATLRDATPQREQSQQRPRHVCTNPPSQLGANMEPRGPLTSLAIRRRSAAKQSGMRRKILELSATQEQRVARLARYPLCVSILCLNCKEYL